MGIPRTDVSARATHCWPYLCHGEDSDDDPISGRSCLTLQALRSHVVIYLRCVSSRGGRLQCHTNGWSGIPLRHVVVKCSQQRGYWIPMLSSRTAPLAIPGTSSIWYLSSSLDLFDERVLEVFMDSLMHSSLRCTLPYPALRRPPISWYR